MYVKGLKENQVADELDKLARGIGNTERGIKDFVVSKVDGEWEIGFTFRTNTDYKLQTKYGEIRKFSRINGIEKWMIKMEITHFSVYL